MTNQAIHGYEDLSNEPGPIDTDDIFGMYREEFGAAVLGALAPALRSAFNDWFSEAMTATTLLPCWTDADSDPLTFEVAIETSRETGDAHIRLYNLRDVLLHTASERLLEPERFHAIADALTALGAELHAAANHSN